MNEAMRQFDAGANSGSAEEYQNLDSDLGPPLDLDSLGNEPLYGNGSEVNNHNFGSTGYFDELRKTPEYLNGQPYRRRQRSNLVLQRINDKPVLLSEKGFKTAEQLSSQSLFSDQVADEPNWRESLFSQAGDSSERFHRPEVGEEGGLRWTANSKELAFLVRHLEDDIQKELGRAYAEGQKIYFRLLWGPRWKLTRFGDQTKPYEWPRDDSVDDPNDFRGSNFVAFTSVSVERNEDNELVVSEKLLVEANLFTKVGSTRIKPRGGPKDGIALDRSIQGLKRRAEEGDIYLTEPERLYNQAVDLYEVDLSKSDEQWVRNALLDFMSGVVDRNGYSVKGTSNMKFRINNKGEVVTDGEDIDQEVRFSPVRVNVRKGGYLEKVLRRIGETSHALNKAHKYKQFRDVIYPVFQQSMEQRMALGLARSIAEGAEQSTGQTKVVTRKKQESLEPHDLLARQLTHSKAMLNRFVPASSPRNLAYILHFFSNDPRFDEHYKSGEVHYERGIKRANLVLGAIEKINQETSKSELHRPYFDTKYTNDCLDRVERMRHPDWLPQDIRSGLVTQISVDEPTLGVNRKRVRPVWDSGPSIFDKPRNGKNGKGGSKYLAPEQRDNLIGFDVYPPKMSIEQVREQLARYGVDVIQTLLAEGDRPAIYALYMDHKPRRMSDGSELSPSQWVNMLRRVFDTQRYTNGRSSKHSIESGFKATEELARKMAEDDPTLLSILKYFDYQERLEATKESKTYSGLAGEVFTRMALNADLATVLGMTELPKGGDYKIIYIDRDRSHQKSKLSSEERKRLNEYITEINSQNPDQGHIIRPDFIVQVTFNFTDKVTELWIDSKAYIKKVTPVAIENLFKHYQPVLNEARKLVIVAHSPMDRITEEARQVASRLGVVIVGSDAIAQALAKFQEDPTSGSAMGDLVTEYMKFKDHPSAYSEDLDKRSGIQACEQLLDIRHTRFGPLFSDTETVDFGREDLVYNR